MFTKCSFSSHMLRTSDRCALPMFSYSECRYWACISGTFSRDSGLNKGWWHSLKAHYHLLREKKEKRTLWGLLFLSSVCKMSESVVKETEKILKYLFSVVFCRGPQSYAGSPQHETPDTTRPSANSWCRPYWSEPDRDLLINISKNAYNIISLPWAWASLLWF